MSTEPIETNPTLVARLGGPTVRKLGWNPALDGARGVSVVLVMSFHFLVQLGNYLDGTPILVDMFFILSGFLITTLLFEERAKKGSISLRNFYLRRVFRLFPAVYALLAVFLVFALIFGGEDRGRFVTEFLAAAFYVYNIFIAWVGVEGQALVQLWTLSLEEQFYFLWPILLIAALKVSKPRRMQVLVGAMISVVVIMPMLRMGIEPSGPWAAGETLGATGAVGSDATTTAPATVTSFIFGFALLRPDSLVLGCLAAMYFRIESGSPSARSERFLPIAGNVALVMFAMTFLLGGIDFFAPFVSPFYNLTVIALSLWILDLIRRPDTKVATLMSHPICLWFGKRSYGIYIWHLLIYFPIQAFFNDVFTGRTKLATLAAFPFAFAATIGVSVLSWNYIETPALRMKARYSHNKD